jgi:small subunit ribosomal protein S6e
MKQGVLVKGRVRLLLTKGHSTYRPKRKGERKRKSVRGCIVGLDIRALSLALVKKGEKDIEGFSNVEHPRRLGPKRVTRIRRLFALTGTAKEDKNGALVKKNVIRRTWTAPSGKTR